MMMRKNLSLISMPALAIGNYIYILSSYHQAVSLLYASCLIFYYLSITINFSWLVWSMLGEDHFLHLSKFQHQKLSLYYYS
jgi:hypothetical protein